MTLPTRPCSWSFKHALLQRAWLLLYITGLLYSFALRAQAQVILSSEYDSPAVRSFTQTLAQALPQHDIRYVSRTELMTHTQFPATTQLILLGPALLDWRLQLSSAAPATLILQVSRVQAHQRRISHTGSTLTFLWSDPPFERQIALLKIMLPGLKQVGVLYSQHSAFLLPEIEQAMQAEQLTLHSYNWPENYDARSLNRLLEHTEVLLGIDDAHIYNPSSIKSILLSSYARKQTLIGPTAAFIKAGSLVSTYSDQDDWIQTLKKLLQTPSEYWPSSQYPSHFKVMINHQVSRSLGIQKNRETQVKQQLEKRTHALAL